VFNSVCSTIETIGEQAGTQTASFGTRYSALETLRKIGKTVCLGSNTIGHEVRKQFQYDPSLEDPMTQIVDYMSDKERTDMLAINDGRSTFMHKMCELEELAQGCCVFEGIGTVIAQLFGPDPSVSGSGDEDEHSDGREDDEEEEEEEQVNGDAGGHDGIKFANDEQEMIFLECFDSGGAPRMDARSQRILAQYH
jgi:hypothetical protein